MGRSNLHWMFFKFLMKLNKTKAVDVVSLHQLFKSSSSVAANIEQFVEVNLLLIFK
jgi:hypothetical protein